MNDLKLIEIFCNADDFCLELEQYIKQFLPGAMSEQNLLNNQVQLHQKRCSLSMSEIMTIEIYFHLSGIKCFKWYYNRLIGKHHKEDFPGLVSYNRFVELKKKIVLALYTFLWYCAIGKCTGLSFIDSTKLAVCHNRRIHSHRVFEQLAKRGKTSVGWFFGFKLHLVINHQGALLGFTLSTGNKDDRNRKIIRQITRFVKGMLIGDKGYVGKQLAKELAQKGIELIAKHRKNMTQPFLDAQRKLFLKKRALIESIIDLIKDVCTLEHSRHRCPINFIANTFAALAAYYFMDNKPSLYFSKVERALINI